MTSTTPQSHSKLPPSKSEIWTVCTASVAYCEENAHLLPKFDSKFADEGTLAHDLAANVLLGKTVKFPSKEMETHVMGYVEFVRSKYQKGDRIQIEKKVPLFYLRSQTGTSDGILSSPKRIAICDLKYGAGVSVYAKENKQLSIYAESSIQEIEVLDGLLPDETPVELYIYQPRDRNDPEPVREWHLTRGELRAFCFNIAMAAGQILRADATRFVAGPHCDKGFCPARGICHAYGTRGLSVVTDEPVDMVLAQPEIRLADPKSLTREQRQVVITMRTGLEKWLEAVEAQEMHELLQGAEPMQFKLVEGKSNRQWRDEDEAKGFLKRVGLAEDVVSPPSIISVAQAEKLIPKTHREEFSELTQKPKGKPSLVPVTDKRPALNINPAQGLENIYECV